MRKIPEVPLWRNWLRPFLLHRIWECANLWDHLPGRGTSEQREQKTQAKGSVEGEAGLESMPKLSRKEALGQLNKHSSMYVGRSEDPV